MLEETLVSYRRAYDGVKSENKPIYECVNKALLDSCKHATQRYNTHLEESKKEEKKKEKDKEEETARQLDDAKKRAEGFRKMSEKLVSEADELTKEAEQKNKLFLLVKSNALREKSHGKRKEMEEEMKNVKSLEKKLEM